MLAVSTEENISEEIMARLAGYEDPSVPLPSTRALGKLLGLSHMTVAKALRQMSERGELWRSETGRYYPKSARFIFDSPKPVVCLLRNISAWAGWYSHLMEGIGQACEQSGRGLLIHPVGALLEQPAADAAPEVLSVAEQTRLLEQMLLRIQDSGERLILDDLWDDRALAAHADRLVGARMLLRPCAVPHLHSVMPNYAQGALLVLSHLLARGFEKLWIIRPFAGEVIDTVVAAFEEAADSVGADASRFEVIDGTRGADTQQIVKRLRQEKGRVGVYCAEENFAVSLFNGLQSAGVRVPESVGLVAGWGTVAANQLGLSSLKLDLRLLGMLAVNLEDSALHPFRPVVDFSLHSGIST